MAKKGTYKNLLFAAMVLTIVVFNRCAQPGSITGGPQDKKPPVMLGSTPVMNGTNFKGNKIQIDFDEFLQLKEASKQLNVSPPLNKKPKLWLKSHSLVIEYADTLRDSTTYTFNFGNGIADNNEGNVLENFEFAFSTGTYLDSMAVRGRILDAFTLKADKESVLAVLYKNQNDSAPYKEIPMYTARTDKDGYYSINNVKPGMYQLYALKDANGNTKYNAGTDAFAFIDTLLILNSAQIAKLLNIKYDFRPDTTKPKTLEDSLKKIKTPDKYELSRERNSIHVDMFSFVETDKKQFLKDYSRKDQKKIDLIFNNPLKGDSFNIKLLYFNTANWYKIEKNQRRDSLSLWITDTSLFQVDTLKTILQYWKTSKQGDTTWKADTILLRYLTPDEVSTKKKQGVEQKMSISFVYGQGGLVDVNAIPIITTQYPIESIDTSKINFVEIVDSLEIPRKYKIERDSLNSRVLKFHHKWDEASKYRITFFPGVFSNIYNIFNDTLDFSLPVQKIDYYGKLILNLEGINSPVIIQLLDGDKVAYQKFTNKSGIVEFDYLAPKSYDLRIIYDTNNDKQWSTGYFIKRIQPEKVVYFDKKLNIRSNWDVEETWSVE
jgi:uncharacterized protein (DUF2141 family)